MSTPRHAAILLAAGGSGRLGTPKQLVEIGGESLVRRAALAALATGPSQAIVVVGANAHAVHRAIADLALDRVDCDDWRNGLSASLRAGVTRLDPTIDGALVVLCDQPALTAAHLERLVELWRSGPRRAAASRYAGTIGVPALLPRSWWSDLCAVRGDHGARELLRSRTGEVVSVDAADLATDVDRPVDLARVTTDP